MTTIAPGTLSEQLLYSTVRLVCGDSVGTGFFFHATLHGHRMPLLVTNRHVISPANPAAITPDSTTIDIELAIHGHRLDLVDGKATPGGTSHVVRAAKHTWFGHPDPAVDLAVLPVASIPNLDGELFHIGLTPAHIMSPERLLQLSAVEDVTMCGAPIGLWDHVHGLPVLRRGTTANHPGLDHQAKPMGLVDIACFPGSSGSPVCLLNEGAYPNKRQTGGDGGVVFGNRLVLLGILFAGPQYNAKGTLEVVPLPTNVDIRAVVPQMIHLGYYVKARELLTIVSAFEARAMMSMPAT